MIDEPMRHDERCNAQDHALTLLEERVRRGDELFRDVVLRVQLLVDQFHAQNVAQATMMGDVTHIRGKVDEIEESLGKDFALRSEFTEIKNEWRRFLGLVLVAVVVAVLGAIGLGMKGGLR